MKMPAHFYGESGGGMFSSFFLLCFFSFSFCFGQKEFLPGVKSNAMGGAVCALGDPDHHSQSPASIAFTETLTLVSQYKNHYLLPELHSLQASTLIPLKNYCLSGFAHRFGPEHYRELRSGIGIAHRISHTALGLRINWEQLVVEGFQTQHALTSEFGGIVSLSPNIRFGANVYNLTLSKFKDKLLPVILRCGMSAQVHPELLFSAEVEKNIYEALVIKWGAQYNMTASLQLLAGFRHPANSLHGGLFFKHRQLSIGYAVGWILRLGISQEFLLAYRIPKKFKQ